MKQMFLGSNTPKGFIGFYDKVVEDGKRLFILKGGSGVGKHTFMKKIAVIYEEKGYNIEYLHCSNDVKSLDGIIIVELEIAFIDGTNPHLVDPKLPAAFDEIIDLGVFLDTVEMEKQKEEVTLFTMQKKKLYASAYNMLSCVNVLYEDNSELLKGCMDRNQLNKHLKTMPQTLINDKSDEIGSIRHVFASSYTASGYYNYIDTLIEGKKTIGIDSYFVFTKIMMNKIYEYAISCGHNVMVCHSPIDSEKIDHLIFDDLAILSIDQYNTFHKVDELHKINDVFKEERIIEIQERQNWNNQKIDIFLFKAIQLMESCNRYHKKLEALYIPNMDFEGVNLLLKNIISKINDSIANP